MRSNDSATTRRSLRDLLETLVQPRDAGQRSTEGPDQCHLIRLILILSFVLSVSALLAAAIGFLAIVQARRHRQLEQIVEERWRDMAHRVPHN